MRSTLLVVGLLLGSLSVSADLLTMKDGRQISGQIEGGDSRVIRVKVGDGTQTFGVDQIQSIQFGGDAATTTARTSFPPIAPPPAPQAPAPLQTPVPAGTPTLQNGAEPAPPPLPIPPPVEGNLQNVTLPAGTEIAIRTIDEIDSKKADLYREYTANIDDAVVVNGLTVLPAHTKAFLKATDIQKAGFKKPPSITLTLVGVILSERRVNIVAGGLDSKGSARGKRTGIGAGIGAGSGAAIGSVFGPVGAGIGAAAGATTGAIIAKATGRGVEFKPETRLTFKLEQPLVIDFAGGAH